MVLHPKANGNNTVLFCFAKQIQFYAANFLADAINDRLYPPPPFELYDWLPPVYCKSFSTLPKSLLSPVTWSSGNAPDKNIHCGSVAIALSVMFVPS